MEVSLKEIIEWENEIYRLWNAISNLLKYPNSRMGNLLDKMYDKLGECPICWEEMSIGTKIEIKE